MLTGLLALLCLPAQPSRAQLTDLLKEPPAVAARARVKSLPAEAQTELFGLYARYSEAVSKRAEEGWLSGLLSGEIVQSSDDNPRPIRQIEEAIRSRQAEIKKLKKGLDRPDSDQDVPRLNRRLEAARIELAALREVHQRAKGICLDWSDMVWSELGKLQPEHWSLRDQERKARPFHTGAVLCSPPEEPKVCLVFDPWTSAEADVFEFLSWDTGSSAGRLPADFFLHELPEPRPVAPASRKTKRS